MNEANVRSDRAGDAGARSLEELGAELKSLRESKGLSLEDVAAATCIRQNFLEDIEKGDFSRFKALVYARGFVRTYAELLDSPQTWEEYSSRLTLDNFAPAQIDSARGRTVYPRGTGPRVSMQPPTSAAAAPARGFRHSSMRRNCIILFFVLAAAAVAGLFGNWDRIHEEISRIQSRQAYDGMMNREAEQAQHDEAKRAEEEAVLREREAQAEAAARAQEEAAAAQTPEPEPEPAPEPPAPEPPKPVFAMRARGDCWIQVNSGSRVLISTTVRNGWEGSFDLDEPLIVRFGNARNISVSSDGENFTPLTGGVMRYEILTDGTMRQIRRN